MKTIRWQFVAEGDGEYAAPFHNTDDVSSDLARREVSTADRERFVVYLLDAKHRPIAFETVSVGVLDGSLIHPREFFKAAVSASAAAILVAHNHPSGDPAPSGQDREVTRRLKAAGELLGVPVIDHVIVGPRGDRYSFREKGDWT